MRSKFLISLLVILLGAALGAAQDKMSLKDLPAGELFTDPEKRFSIALPREGFKTENEEIKGEKKVTRYKWWLREGRISIAVIVFDIGSLDNPILIDSLMAVTARRHVEEDGATIISRDKLDLGTVHGGEIVRKDPDGQKVIFRMYATGLVMYTLTVFLDKKASNAESLMKTALKSFKLTTAKGP